MAPAFQFSLTEMIDKWHQHRHGLESTRDQRQTGEVSLKLRKSWRLHEKARLSFEVNAAAVFSDRPATTGINEPNGMLPNEPQAMVAVYRHYDWATTKPPRRP
jgi:hypothetical protein